ncbi:MAG: hypothetical protein K1X57_19820, partial [Gemmataceae bacterium]|nr:hypothetical protein [Gemmataceae bacterium]
VAVFFLTTVTYYSSRRARTEVTLLEKQQDRIGLSVASHQDSALLALNEGRYVDAEVEATRGLLLREDALCLLWRATARQQIGKEKEALEDTLAGLAAAEKSDLPKECKANLCNLAARLLKAEADRIEGNFDLDAARPTYDKAASYCRRALDLVPEDKTAANILKTLPR